VKTGGKNMKIQIYNIIAIYLYKNSLYNNIRMIGKIFKHLTNGENGEKVDKTISSNDRIVNNLLLLRLIGETNDFGKLEHQLKVQKLVFLIQKNFVQRKLKGFSYNFFRWEQGPFSADVNNDLKLLKKSKLITWDDDEILLTKQGADLLKECDEVFKENIIFNKPFESVVKSYANFTPEEIKEEVYKQNIFVPKIRKVMSIDKIPLKQLILFRPTIKKMKELFKIDEEWEATLELLLDKEGLVSLGNALNDAMEGKHGKPIRVHSSGHLSE
jgi:uncharacterized protein YwgA